MLILNIPSHKESDTRKDKFPAGKDPGRMKKTVSRPAWKPGTGYGFMLWLKTVLKSRSVSGPLPENIPLPGTGFYFILSG
jgi:hypothetical protein